MPDVRDDLWLQWSLPPGLVDESPIGAQGDPFAGFGSCAKISAQDRSFAPAKFSPQQANALS